MTQITAKGRVGPAYALDGVEDSVRLGRSLEQMVSDTHPRFYESNYRGALFSGGMGLTSISNATFTSATVGVTATPVAGVYNPSTNKVNLVILQAMLGVTVTAGTATGGGPFVWMTSIGNAAVSTGASPLNRATLVAAGSNAKDVTGVALTGLTTNLAVRFASALNGGLVKNISSVETAIGQNIGTAGVTFENIDGGIIVPPGGVLALMATTTPVAHSAVSGLVWEEVAV